MEGTLKILVVDDDPGALAVLASGLEDLAQVSTAENGQEGLALAAISQPDIVLLDIELPDINGFDVCKRIKEQAYTKVPSVIFITSHHDYETERKALEMGGSILLPSRLT